MQRLQKLLDSRGGEFDGEMKKIMILVEFGAVGQDMVGVWGMRKWVWRGMSTVLVVID